MPFSECGSIPPTEDRFLHVADVLADSSRLMSPHMTSSVQGMATEEFPLPFGITSVPGKDLN
jgi:hypothetical protein